MLCVEVYGVQVCAGLCLRGRGGRSRKARKEVDTMAGARGCKFGDIAERAAMRVGVTLGRKCFGKRCSLGPFVFRGSVYVGQECSRV